MTEPLLRGLLDPTRADALVRVADTTLSYAALLTSAGSAFCGAAAVLATMPTLKMGEHEARDKSASAVATVVLSISVVTSRRA